MIKSYILLQIFVSVFFILLFARKQHEYLNYLDLVIAERLKMFVGRIWVRVAAFPAKTRLFVIFIFLLLFHFLLYFFLFCVLLLILFSCLFGAPPISQ